MLRYVCILYMHAWLVMYPGRWGAWYTGLGAQKRFFNFLCQDFF